MKITLVQPLMNAVVSLLPEGQRALRAGTYSQATAAEVDWLNPQLDGTERSGPLPVQLSWRVEGGEALRCEVCLSTGADLADAAVIPGADNAAQAMNLLIGQEYFWQVRVYAEEGVVTSPVGRFVTEDMAPRLIAAEGLTNIRDVGGWRNAQGQQLRQGLFYRGSEMDTHHTLTEAAKRVLRDDLGIKTDLDIRAEAVGRITESPLGADVSFQFIPTHNAYDKFVQPDAYETCRQMFSVLADEANYPLYVHCWGGADRTGTLVLLFQAILGLDDESLMQDYELTTFSIWGRRSRDSKHFCALMDAMNEWGSAEEPLSVKAERYLLAAGVKQAEIDSIRRIFLL